MATFIYNPPNGGTAITGHQYCQKENATDTCAEADWTDYRLGYSLAVVQGGAMSFQFGLDAQRRESLGRGDADHSLVGRLTVGW